MRRQLRVGKALPAGSGREQRPDPSSPSLPLLFNARDERADGGLRQIQITRARIIIKRSVQTIRMVLNVRVDEYFAITLRAARPEDNMPGAWVLWLEHRDRSLSVPLFVSADGDEIRQAGVMWADYFRRADLIDTGGIGSLPDLMTAEQGPAPRRRRRNAIRNRRPRFPMRRKTGSPKQGAPEERLDDETIEDLGLM